MQIEVQWDAEAVASGRLPLSTSTQRGFRGAWPFHSGGQWRPHSLMLRMLGEEEVPWGGVHVPEVDERIAHPGDPDLGQGALPTGKR